MFEDVKSLTFNEDCIAYMQTIPNQFFDLAVADPPYGIGQDWKKRYKGKPFKETTYRNDCRATKEFIEELKRVSKNQIIWGYNYISDLLGPTNYLIVWDKQSNANQKFRYSKAEIAYTSIRIPCNLVSIPWDGYRMGAETGTKKIHPHQKPIQLYKWLFETYSKPGDVIFDSHLGSGSSRIAAYDMHLDFYGCEIDRTYFELQEKRFEDYLRRKAYG